MPKEDSTAKKDEALNEDGDFVLDLENLSPEDDPAGSEESSEVSYNAAEERALDDGWLPLEEWIEAGKSEDDWVSAKEFNFRGELMGRISSQSNNISKQTKEIGQLKEALRALSDMNKKLSKKQYDKFQKELEDQKIEALENHDHRQVVEIDKQLEGLKELDPDNTKVIPDDWEDNYEVDNDQPSIPPEVSRWLDRPSNKWYHNDVGMRGAADAYAVEFRQTNPNGSFDEMLSYVDKNIIKEFPHKFNRKKSTQGNRGLAEGTKEHSTHSSKNTKYTVADLNETQRAIGKTLVEEGTFKKMDEYIDQLVELGELG